MASQKFQFLSDNRWQNYPDDKDKALKRAFMFGSLRAEFSLQGEDYICDFIDMRQTNKSTGEDCKIRPPDKWKPFCRPTVPRGETTIIKIPPRAAGSVIQLPHPSQPGQLLTVRTPSKAKPGQTMLVPLPPEKLPPLLNAERDGGKYFSEQMGTRSWSWQRSTISEASNRSWFTTQSDRSWFPFSFSRLKRSQSAKLKRSQSTTCQSW